jgi:hypothetical protein
MTAEETEFIRKPFPPGWYESLEREAYRARCRRLAWERRHSREMTWERYCYLNYLVDEESAGRSFPELRSYYLKLYDEHHGQENVLR